MEKTSSQRGRDGRLWRTAIGEKGGHSVATIQNQEKGRGEQRESLRRKKALAKVSTEEKPPLWPLERDPA